MKTVVRLYLSTLLEFPKIRASFKSPIIKLLLEKVLIVFYSFGLSTSFIGIFFFVLFANEGFIEGVVPAV